MPLSRSAMISFQPRNHAVDQARRAAVRRVADWVEEALPEEQRDATHVMVNQVECREEGCPPVECVVALLRKPKIVFRVRPHCDKLLTYPRPCPKGIIARPAHSPHALLSYRGCRAVALRSSSSPRRR